MLRRSSRFVLFAAAFLAAITQAQSAPLGNFDPGRVAKQSPQRKPVNGLVGKWVLVNNPVDAAGRQSPDIPKTIEFFKDGTLMMSHIGDIHMPYKTELTARDADVFEGKPGMKGKKLLLVRPSSDMEWTSTPMVYIIETGGNELTLTVQGYEKALFRRGK